MIKKIIIIYCLLCFYLGGNAQRLYQTDSLYRVVSSQDDNTDENISYLYLSNYHNPHLLKRLHKFKKLKVLEIYNLPEIKDWSFLQKMKDLEILSINKCGLSIFFIKDTMLLKLRHLNLRGNNIDQIVNLDKLSNLESLMIGYNRFKQIPNISKLDKLKKLSIHSNKLSGVIDFKKFPPNISYLDLGSNSLNKIKGISKKNALITYLNLIFNDFKSLPSNIYKLKSLSTLDVSYNQLTTFPKKISKIDCIYEIFANDNQLKYFPQGFKILKQLDISFNQFEEFPNPCDGGLFTLNIANNNIKSIPNYVLEWEDLFILDISYTRITDFPEKPFSSEILHIKAVQTMIEKSEIDNYKEKYGIEIQVIELDM